jgi:CRP/FNR family cyclic AMP-dependent transcriptional regulator
MVKHLDLLQLVPLFRELTQEELERIWNIAIQRSYSKRTAIFMEGSDKEAVFFIQDGLVKTYKTDENGHEQIVSFLKTGDMFPHTGFFNENPYPATAEAIVDTHLLAIPVRSFELLMTSTPNISIKVMRAMSEKIIELQVKLQGLTGQDVQDRGLSFLLKLAENYGMLKNDKVYIDVPMTHQEFASAIGTTRETVNRLINQLRKEKLLETDRNGFIILDYEALKKWSHK